MMQISSISLVTGVSICLRSATKITHRAYSITSLAAKWHVCATINSSDNTEGETPRIQITSDRVFHINADCESDDEEGDGDNDLHNTKLVPVFSHTISFQKRQALGEGVNHQCFKQRIAIEIKTRNHVNGYFDICCSDIFREQQSRNYSVRFHAGQNVASLHFCD